MRSPLFIIKFMINQKQVRRNRNADIAEGLESNYVVVKHKIEDFVH
jgi:hypothetical protein